MCGDYLKNFHPLEILRQMKSIKQLRNQNLHNISSVTRHLCLAFLAITFIHLSLDYECHCNSDAASEKRYWNHQNYKSLRTQQTQCILPEDFSCRKQPNSLVEYEVCMEDYPVIWNRNTDFPPVTNFQRNPQCPTYNTH